MNPNFAVIVSSRAEDFSPLFPGKTCHNLMQVDFDKLSEDYVLYIERDYYKGFDFQYFLGFDIDKVNLGLICEEKGSWLYGFDDNYLVNNKGNVFKEDFSFSGVALFEKNYFLSEFGLDFMLKAQSVARSIPTPKLKNLPKEKALFLDRDGVLIKDTHYPHKKEDLKLNEEVLPLLKWGKENNYKLIVLTNQSGIAREMFSFDQYQEFSNLLTEEFKKHDIAFDGIYCSPCHPDGKGEYASESFLRKPWPGMLVQAIEDHHIDSYQSYMIGDKISDRLKAPLKKYYIVEGNYPLDLPDKFQSFAEVLEDLKSL